MAQVIVDLGTAPDAGDGDPARIAFGKVNNNATDAETRLGALEGSVAWNEISGTTNLPANADFGLETGAQYYVMTANNSKITMNYFDGSGAPDDGKTIYVFVRDNLTGCNIDKDAGPSFYVNGETTTTDPITILLPVNRIVAITFHNGRWSVNYISALLTDPNLSAARDDAGVSQLAIKTYVDTFVAQASSAQIDITQPNISNITVDGGVGVGTTFSLAAADRVVIPELDGTISTVSFGALPSIVPNFSSGVICIYRDSLGAVVQLQATSPPTTRRTHAFVGEILVNPTGGVIDTAQNLQLQFFQTGNILFDLIDFFGSFASSSLKLIPNGVATSFGLQAGEGLALNVNADRNTPIRKSFATQATVTFIPFLSTGAVESVVYGPTPTVVDPTFWNDPGTPGALQTIAGSNNQAQIFRVFLRTIDDQIEILHGQEIFSTLQAAIDGLPLLDPTIPVELTVGTIDMGGFIAIKGAVDFNVATDAVFFTRSNLAGGIGSGAVIIPDLDQIFFNSYVKGPSAPIDPGDSGQVAIQKLESNTDDVTYYKSITADKVLVTADIQSTVDSDAGPIEITLPDGPTEGDNHTFFIDHATNSIDVISVDPGAPIGNPLEIQVENEQAHWILDGDFLDSSVNGRDLTLTGSTGGFIVSTFKGRSIDMYDFAGADFLTAIGYKGILGSTVRSMAFIFQYSGTPGTVSSDQSIIEWGANNSGQDINLIFQNSGQEFKISIFGNSKAYNIAGAAMQTLLDGSAHSVGISFSNSTTASIQLYIDDAPIAHDALGNGTMNTVAGNDLTVGSNNGAAILDAAIANFELWDSTVSAAEFEAYFAAPIGGGISISFAGENIEWKLIFTDSEWHVEDALITRQLAIAGVAAVLAGIIALRTTSFSLFYEGVLSTQANAFFAREGFTPRYLDSVITIKKAFAMIGTADTGTPVSVKLTLDGVAITDDSANQGEIPTADTITELVLLNPDELLSQFQKIDVDITQGSINDALDLQIWLELGLV